MSGAQFQPVSTIQFTTAISWKIRELGLLENPQPKTSIQLNSYIFGTYLFLFPVDRKIKRDSYHSFSTVDACGKSGNIWRLIVLDHLFEMPFNTVSP